MAFDAFIKIPGVDGESTRKGFEKQIAILSFSLGASNPSSIGAGGGGGAGKASISSFNLMKHSDITSPLLFQACCQGTALRQSDGAPQQGRRQSSAQFPRLRVRAGVRRQCSVVGLDPAATTHLSSRCR